MPWYNNQYSEDEIEETFRYYWRQAIPWLYLGAAIGTAIIIMW